MMVIRGLSVPASDRMLLELTYAVTIKRIWQLPLETMVLEAKSITAAFIRKSKKPCLIVLSREQSQKLDDVWMAQLFQD